MYCNRGIPASVVTSPQWILAGTGVKRSWTSRTLQSEKEQEE